jgi:AraC-like DNA-binding protein
MHELACSDLPISDIAMRLGYGSFSELHRAFRSWVGIGPAAYRRSHRVRGAAEHGGPAGHAR